MTAETTTSSDVLTLVMTPNNPVNCTLATEDGKVYYTVITEHTDKATITQVRDANNDVIASLEWRDTLADRVTIGTKKAVSLWDWLKKSLIPFNSSVTFTDEDGKTLKWKGYSPGRSLELYATKPDSPAPIARFVAPRRLPNPEDKSLPPIWTEAQLLLDSQAQKNMNAVVTSFLFLEKNRRTNETTSQNASDVRGAPPLGAVAGQNYKARNGGV